MQDYSSRNKSSFTQEDILRLCSELLQAEISQTGEIFRILFQNAKIAQEIFEFLYAILPIRGGQYPQLNHRIILLTEEQVYFVHLYKMQQEGKMSEDALGDQYLLKTLRDDDKDFSGAFISGIIPGPNGARYQNLRPAAQGLFTHSADDHPISRLNKTPRHPEKKKGFSQIQSCTLVDKGVWSTPFGFSKIRMGKLYGLMTHLKDTLIRGYLVKDSGTVARPFDFQSLEAVKTSMWSPDEEKNPSERRYYPSQKFEEFKVHNCKLRSDPEAKGTNEILARLRFNPYRSIVAICAATLESRLLAFKFSQDLLEEFRAYALKNGIQLNPDYKIPIIVYLPNITANYNMVDPWTKKYFEDPDFIFYTEEMRQLDSKTATKTTENPDSRLHIFFGFETINGPTSTCNYDLLLGVDNLTDEHFRSNSEFSLVHHMFEDGFIKRAVRLLGPFEPRNRNNRCYRAMCTLLNNRYVNINLTISRLIIAEEFEIASFFLEKTALNKDELPDLNEYLPGSLIDFLISKGNPRHFQFMGLEEMLKKAAEAEAWVPIKLCIKEFPNETKPLLGFLLHKACQQRRPVEVNFLLAKEADKTFSIEKLTPIVCSAYLQDWITLAIFARYSTDNNDEAQYGPALLIALKFRQRGLAKLLLQAGAKTKNRHGEKAYELESPLFYALLDDCDELLEPLFHHEEPSLVDSDTARKRLYLIRDLALFKNNNHVEKLVNDKIHALSISEADYSELDRCVLVFEALAIGDTSFALRRMAMYLLSPYTMTPRTIGPREFSNGIAILNRNLTSAIKYIDKRHYKQLTENIILLTLQFQDLKLLNTIIILFSHLIGLVNTDQNVSSNKYTYNHHNIPSIIFKIMGGEFDHPRCDFDIEMIIFDTLLLNIDEHNFLFIQEIIGRFFNNSRSKERWEALLLKALDTPSAHVSCLFLDPPSEHRISCLHKLHGLLYCTLELPSNVLHFILRNGYNQNLDSKIISYLDEIIQYENYKINCKKMLLNLWIYHPYFSENLITAILARLGTDYLQHLTLLMLNDILQSHIYGVEKTLVFQKLGDLSFYKMTLAPSDDSSEEREKLFDMNFPGNSTPKKKSPYQNLLTILEEYFKDNILPSSNITSSFFDRVIEYFSSTIAQSNTQTFFKEHSDEAHFNRKMLEYLNCVKNICDPHHAPDARLRYTFTAPSELM